ncbi:MAG: exodeoxyribonuclease VII large subunit [Mogibacterium sp.]|nr:exodeoxyribonuclease VII large subunit [Mogibacterium sp.]
MKPVTVSQINEYLARRLSGDFNLQNIAVTGEISGLSFRGHVYFTLKDENSVLRAVIWQQNLGSIDRKLLTDGRKILAFGSIKPYAKGGYYSFHIQTLEDAGIGKAAREFEELRRKLEAEGLFDKKYKKPLPQFPRRIGVVTSTEGDALRDIRKIVLKKNDYTDILIFPAYVQGIYAVRSLVEGIETANRVSASGLPIDILIVGRGGGSAEDLAAFNDEQVARAVFASDIPVISAVGHETNVSICDFVADVRAETPTAAAEIAVPDTEEIRRAIASHRQFLIEQMRSRLTAERRMLDAQKDLLRLNMRQRLDAVRHAIERSELLLREGDPRRVFARGFAAVLDTDGRIIPDIGGIEDGRTYRIRMRDGSFLALASDIQKTEKGAE